MAQRGFSGPPPPTPVGLMSRTLRHINPRLPSNIHGRHKPPPWPAHPEMGNQSHPLGSPPSLLQALQQQQVLITHRAAHLWQLLPVALPPAAAANQGPRLTAIGLMTQVARWRPHFLLNLCPPTTNGPLPVIFLVPRTSLLCPEIPRISM